MQPRSSADGFGGAGVVEPEPASLCTPGLGWTIGRGGARGASAEIADPRPAQRLACARSRALGALRTGFHALAREVRANGSELRLILVPHRPELGRAEQGTTTTRAWLRDLATAAKVPVASGHDEFAAVVDRGQLDASFGDAHPLDIHLSAAGHARFARWLAKTLAQP